ncbi:MAG: hypothetical protein ACYC93_09320 [Candidatus Acidiferrales bacterium]
MLGDIFRRAAMGSKNEQERARWRAEADSEYAHIVQEYPLSSLTPEAKRRLSEDNVKIPPPDPEALARAKYEEKFAHDHPGLIHRAMGVIKSNPSVASAAHTGAPDLNPPGENESPQGVNSASDSGIDAGSAGSAQQNMSIRAVSPESSIPPPTSSATDAAPPTDPASTSSSTSTSTPPATNAVPPPTASDSGASGTSTATSTPATGTDPQSAADAQKPAAKKKVDKSKESTSKHKKGLKRLIPW